MFAERGDFTIVHEPFSQLTDFGETMVGHVAVHSEDELIASLRELSEQTPVFFKDTTDFRYPRLLADAQFLADVMHTFIIREPAAAIASHYALNPNLERDEVGFARVAELFDLVTAAQGRPAPVVDADELVARPGEVVRAYCERVGIPFLPESLHWSPGLRDDWKRTSQWHASTSATEGFTAAADDDGATAEVLSNPVLAGYLEFHRPFYEKLRDARLRPVAASA
jgi:hypothetical protein